ncbi:hypothetical protein [Persicitalea sp.]|uniref:hypothetical protein n=1 Tax=Persicitalea sp. TaxID=3100273 RepID=UPI0035944D06
MKTLLFSLALLLCSNSFTTAQNFFLPVSSTSKTAKATYYKAAEFASNIHPKEADEQLDKALQEDPNFFMAYVLKIFYANKDKKPDLLTKALALDAGKLNKAEKILRQQLVNWQADPKAKTSETMSALVAAYPKTPQAYEWASLHAVYTDRDSAAALAYAQKLATVNPSFAANYNTMGYMYMGMKQMDQAKAAFEKYIALASKEPNAYDSMAEFYMNAKDYARSAEYYDKAAELGLADAKARADKAREMMKQK